MISIVVYGRHDTYGYNLAKRGALRLNCMAEELTEPDEILFVDYNTPDDFPTFPEASDRLPRSGWVAIPASTRPQCFRRLSQAAYVTARE